MTVTYRQTDRRTVTFVRSKFSPRYTYELCDKNENEIKHLWANDRYCGIMLFSSKSVLIQ